MPLPTPENMTTDEINDEIEANLYQMVNSLAVAKWALADGNEALYWLTVEYIDGVKDRNAELLVELMARKP